MLVAVRMAAPFSSLPCVGTCNAAREKSLLLAYLKEMRRGFPGGRNGPRGNTIFVFIEYEFLAIKLEKLLLKYIIPQIVLCHGSQSSFENLVNVRIL